MHWWGYIDRRGSLNMGRRIEQGLADLKLMKARELGNTDQDVYDYLPHEDAPLLTFDDLRQQYESED